MNSSGKVVTIFLVIIAVLLVSLTAVSLFLRQKEIEKRQTVEKTLKETQTTLSRSDEELKETKKQAFLLQEKNKENDKRINDLMDELELQKGLRDEAKKESETLKGKLEEEVKNKQELQDQKDESDRNLKESQDKLTEIQSKLDEAMTQKTELEKKSWDLEQKNQEFEKNMEQLKGQLEKTAPASAPTPTSAISPDQSSAEPMPGQEAMQKKIDPQQAMDEASPAQMSTANMPSPLPTTPKVRSLDVELDPIVVNPDKMADENNASAVMSGRILSVDKDVEFVIVNLGSKDGVKVGDQLSVYHAKKMLGDIKITRVQAEMSAADLVSPLAINDINKNDQVVAKQ